MKSANRRKAGAVLEYSYRKKTAEAKKPKVPRERISQQRNRKADRQDFARKEAQVQWQTSRILFITGGRGPADRIRPHPKAAEHSL